MALFNWFFNRSDSSKKLLATATVRGAERPAHHRGNAPAASTLPPPVASRPPLDPTNRSEERKAKRHVRREQLYSAIRQAMTRAGVLSASFKFKVLSLDQRGDQFLVMMDLHPNLGLQEEKLAESETLIIQTAKTQFGILVTSVYWRVDAKAESAGLKHSGFDSSPVPLAAQATPPTIGHAPAFVGSKPAARYEPIADDEVTAFKRALANSAAQHAVTAPAALAAIAPATLSAVTPVAAAADSAAKSRSGLRSYTLITGFEDTEMPESAAVPALSATQYGDLN